jgi:hypothetical protein
VQPALLDLLEQKETQVTLELLELLDRKARLVLQDLQVQLVLLELLGHRVQ